MTIRGREQPQVNSDGEFENPRHQENRILTNREAEKKESRHWSRWRVVSNLTKEISETLTVQKNTSGTKGLLGIRWNIERWWVILIVIWKSGIIYWKLSSGMVRREWVQRSPVLRILKRFIILRFFPGIDEKLMHTWTFWIRPGEFMGNKSHLKKGRTPIK